MQEIKFLKSDKWKLNISFQVFILDQVISEKKYNHKFLIGKKKLNSENWIAVTGKNYDAVCQSNINRSL